MANFTPQQIEEFLQEFFGVVGARQYIGARYVPIFGRAGEDTVEWDDLAPYEPLTVVMHEGVSYVSRRYVPTGIDITDTDYWVETYRFNAQVEQYRQEVLSFQDQIDNRIPFPDPDLYPRYGELGQVLSTLTDGTVMWQDPVVPSDAQAEEVISQWLVEHPEATTTVQDGSLTFAKLATSLVSRLMHSEGTLQLDDANAANFNSIFASGGGTYENTPDEFNGSGILITFASQSGTSDNSPRVQLICDTINYTMWWRSIWGSSASQWGDWQRIATGADVQTLSDAISDVHTSARVLHAGGAISTATSADDLPNNTIVYGAPANITNLPAGTSWTQAIVVTMAGRTSESDGGVRLQLAASCNSSKQEMYLRSIWGSEASQWTDWVPIATPDTFNAMMNTGDNRRFVRAKDSLGGTSETPMDVGNAPWNSVCFGGTGTCTGLPTDITSGNFILLTLATQIGAGSNSPRMQVLWTANQPNHYDMYIRNKWGSGSSVWTPWTKMVTERNVLTIVGQSMPALVATNPDDLYTMGAFDRIAGVGDSFMSGAIYPKGGSSGVASGLDTGIARQIAKHCNTTVVKYAQGGRGAYDFIHDNDNNLAQLITDGTANAYDLVILEFGINDASSNKTFGGVSGGMSYMGSSADIAVDYHNNANSFWGQMSYIISALKEAFPTRLIALMGICSYGSSSTTLPAFNTAIREIAAYHGVAFLDMQTDPVIQSTAYTDHIYGGHPNYQAYTMIAKAADRVFSKVAATSDYLQDYYGAYGA